MNLFTLAVKNDFMKLLIDAAPFISSLIAHLIAQGIKPLSEWPKIKRFHIQAIFMSGGFPSSHTSTIFALATMVGLIEGFESTYFMITMVFALLFAYDAMNVRLYAGRNIKLTKKLIEDLQKSESVHINLEDPIYSIKMKDVLGHKLIEVIAGALLGTIISLSYYYLIVK
jgi:hypothetical protein